MLPQIVPCQKPWLYVAPSIRGFSWLIVYWTTFGLSWLVAPFLQGYVMAGEFDMFGKALYSLRINLIFYALTLAVLALVVFCLVVGMGSQMGTGQAIVAMLMAISNAGGLLAVMAFLGGGLVQVPRRLWQRSDAKKELLRLEARAVQVKEESLDSEANLAQLRQELQLLPIRARHRPELKSYVDRILLEQDYADEDLGSGAHFNSQRDPQPAISLSYIVSLNYRIQEARSDRARTAWQWQRLCQRAFHLQDICANEQLSFDSCWSSSLQGLPDESPRWKRQLAWNWHVRLVPILFKGLALIAVLLSLSVLWSELTLALSSNARLSLIRILLEAEHSSSFILLLFLFYLAICTYSSFLQLKVFSFFRLVPRHTDEKSLLFFAAYINRLVFPLGYNYLTLIEGSSSTQKLQTQFSLVMGTMDLVPLLGRYFNLYAPLTLALFVGLIAWRLDHRILDLCNRCFGRRTELLDGDEEESETEVSAGRDLINLARRIAERSQESHIPSDRFYSKSWLPWQSKNINSTHQLLT